MEEVKKIRTVAVAVMGVVVSSPMSKTARVTPDVNSGHETISHAATRLITCLA